MSTATGTYATVAAVKARLGSETTWPAADTTMLSSLCDQINAWIEGEAGRTICPLSDTAMTLDGLAADDSRRLAIPWGIRTLTKLELAPITGATFVEVPTTDFFLRPLAYQRDPGWPATWVVLTDVPSAGNSAGWFAAGFMNVKLTGTFGWAAIPDEVAELAVTAVVRAWHARQAGQTDVIGSDDFGRPIVSRYVSGRDRATLSRYSVRPRVAGGGPTVTAWGR